MKLLAPNPDSIKDKETDKKEEKDAQAVVPAETANTADAPKDSNEDASLWAHLEVPEFKYEYQAVAKEDIDTPEKLLDAQTKLLAFQDECFKYAEKLKQHKD